VIKPLIKFYLGMICIIAFWAITAFILSYNNKYFGLCLMGFFVTFISYSFVGSIYYLRIKHFLPIQREMDMKDALYSEGKLSEEDNIQNKNKRMNYNLLFLILLVLSLIVRLIRFMIK